MGRYRLQGALGALFCASTALPQVTFTFTSFDPPGSTETHAFSVNNAGTVVDTISTPAVFPLVTSDRRPGQFGHPITIAGTNLLRHGNQRFRVVSGYYYPVAGGNETSFTYQGGTFTSFTVFGDVTQIDRINDNGDLTGIYIANGTSYPGFLYKASTATATSFTVPGAAATFAEGLNKNDLVVGILHHHSVQYLSIVHAQSGQRTHHQVLLSRRHTNAGGRRERLQRHRGCVHRFRRLESRLLRKGREASPRSIIQARRKPSWTASTTKANWWAATSTPADSGMDSWQRRQVPPARSDAGSAALDRTGRFVTQQR